MNLTAREIALISVGASVAANCQPCLEYNAQKADEAGLSTQDIQAAAEVAKNVRSGAAAQMDRLIGTLTGPSCGKSPNTGCSCGCS